MPHAKTSYVCLPCRASYKQPYLGDQDRLCPRCAKPMIHVGSAFAAPRRRDKAGWSPRRERSVADSPIRRVAWVRAAWKWPAAIVARADRPRLVEPAGSNGRAPGRGRPAEGRGRRGSGAMCRSEEP
ncbi:deoxyxylulose-5-phosphate synthase [Streptomyces antimycoticus]|uniref:deoxyxylulose-5-phosphate synthase n=1 Tax=Streptomyces antimycoticus TaxID=68175 RepID=UPI0033E25725|nr:deoxyxylulose-5-phosphate synthase [Streptomyces antimycoticus]